MKTYDRQSLYRIFDKAQVNWKGFLCDNNLTEKTREINSKSVHGLYLVAPDEMDSGLCPDAYDALYRHWKLRPDGGPISDHSAPLLAFPFTAEEFLRFERLLVDELRGVVTLWVEETDKDGKQKLSEVVNQKLIDRLPLDSQELARLLLGEEVGESDAMRSIATALQPSAVTESEPTIPARQPSHVLTPAVKQAIKKTPHPITWQEVWLVLVDLAKTEERPYPLTGYKDEELVYKNSKSTTGLDEPGFMSRTTFGREWNRQWKELVSNLEG